MLNYLPYIITILLGVISLIIKDWGTYKKSWLRIMVLFLIVLSGGAGMINQHYSDKRIETEKKETKEQHQKDQIQIARLEEAVVMSTRNQEINTKQFLEETGKLSQKLSELQTQVKTAELKKEVAELQDELQKTQKALNPPKAVLTFSFAGPALDADAIRTTTLPVKNGVVHVEFTVINQTDVAALDGELTLAICERCEFASEPPNFIKLSGQKQTQRNMLFERILHKSKVQTLSADVKVPPNVPSVEFGISYRCRNCITPEPKDNVGVIYLDRRG